MVNSNAGSKLVHKQAVAEDGVGDGGGGSYVVTSWKGEIS